MVTITGQIFINIFQTERFSAVKFVIGLWEKYELSCDTKITKSLKKVEKIGLGTLKIAWATKIPMPFLSSLDNLPSDAYIIFQEGVDNFEIEHKIC